MVVQGSSSLEPDLLHVLLDGVSDAQGVAVAPRPEPVDAAI